MYKQVIVIRQDLKLSKGKLAAQVAHASLEAYKKASPRLRQAWEAEGSKKVVLKVKTPETLKSLHKRARALGLAHSLIRDAGRTELIPGTVTCLGIGPGREGEINKLTGKLKML